MATQPTYPDPFTRTMLTIASTAAVMMVTIDATIAIIALPRIASNLAASQEQITWILTSYLVASAIATPLSGWLANRFGRNRVIALSIVSFTLASIGCGVSPTLEVLVLFRFLQGATGAAMTAVNSADKTTVRDRVVIDDPRRDADQGGHRLLDERRLWFAAQLAAALRRAFKRRTIPRDDGAGTRRKQ